MVRFREVQRFRQPWLWTLLAGIVVLFGYRLLPLLIDPLGDQHVADRAWAGVGVVPILFVIWFWNLRLVTEVREDEICIHFLWLWRPRRIPFSKIFTAQAVTYRPIADYGGWGIRYGPKGGAFNVSGNRGVQLELAGGNRLLIGSQHAEELAAAIQQEIGPSLS